MCSDLGKEPFSPSPAHLPFRPLTLFLVPQSSDVSVKIPVTFGKYLSSLREFTVHPSQVSVSW